ncbi:hypothetical protein HDU93_007920 [Gonapodya sp. JEL0774]|nr:hypothetical protein HDU93_007920 [Gonapodya sp. JEL0774]
MTTLAHARCECGYIDDLGRLWTDAIVYPSFRNTTFNTAKSDLRITVNQLPNDSGVAGVPAPYQIQNDRDNVMISGDELWIRVKAGVLPGGVYVSGGEVVTMRTDILYGTFRSNIQITPNNGTCSGFFYYGDVNNEIDIEILSTQIPDQKVNFVQNIAVGVDPSADFNEYRIDWTPPASDFFVNSAKQTTLTANEPTLAGSVIFNHWSKGLAGWDQGPPTNDSYLRIRSFKFFFNTTDSTGFVRRCNASMNAKVPLATSRCSTENIIGNVTVTTDAAGIEFATVASSNLASSQFIANWALYGMAIGCGAIAIMALATFPIRYVRAKQYEKALNEYREINDEDGYDARSGSSGGTLEMGKYGNKRYNGPRGWKWGFTEPPNFTTPLIGKNSKTQQGDIDRGNKPPRKPNKTYAGPGGDRGDPRWQGPPPDGMMPPAPDYDYHDPADDSDATWAGSSPGQRGRHGSADAESDRRSRKSVNGGRGDGRDQRDRARSRDRGDRGDRGDGGDYAQPSQNRRSESSHRPQYPAQAPQSMAAPYAQSQRRPSEPAYQQSQGQYRQAPPTVSNVQPRWASGTRPPMPNSMDVQGPPPSDTEEDIPPPRQPSQPRYSNNGGGNGGQGRRR